jgi:ABC-type lipoprotein release transport system permease subunit
MLKNIFKFAWRNIWRNKRRTLFTTMAIVMGMITLIFAKSYIGGIMTNSVESVVKTQIGHIRIAHSEYLRLERIFPKENLITDVSKVRELKFTLLLSYKDVNEPCIAIGIDPVAIDKSMDLSKTITKGQYFDSDQTKLIIGKGLADKMKVNINNELLLVTTDINYSTYALPFNIKGIFETGYSVFDKHVLYIPIEKAREMLDAPETAHEILLFLENPKEAELVAGKIKSILDQNFPENHYRVIPYQQSDMVRSFLPMIEKVFGKIIMIIMFIVALVILNTMLMAVMERFHEIGVLKALGFKNHNVVTMIFIEAFCIGTIGAVIGGMIGGALSAFVEKTGINFEQMIGPEVWDKMDTPMPFFSKIIYPDFTIEILISSVIFGIFITLLAVVYPAYKSSKMLPVDAFRSKLNI